MQYERKIVDLDTGEASWIELGDHRPLSDVATMFGVGPREFRRLLTAMTIVSAEWDDISKQYRHRLTSGAVASNFGIRHDNKNFQHSKERTPFDVLSPLGVEYIRHHLKKAQALLSRRPPPMAAAADALTTFETRRSQPLNAEGKVRWLLQTYPAMTHAQVAEIVSVTRQAVSKFVTTWETQVRTAKARTRSGPGWVQGVNGAELAMAA